LTAASLLVLLGGEPVSTADMPDGEEEVGSKFKCGRPPKEVKSNVKINELEWAES
jgi:hypothetical protein